MPKTKKHGRLKEMKFIAAICIIVCLAVFPAAAATYLEDVRNLGYVSGEGLACGAERYPSYELIARAYLVSKARSDSEQADGMYEYNKAKATAMVILVAMRSTAVLITRKSLNRPYTKTAR